MKNLVDQRLNLKVFKQPSVKINFNIFGLSIISKLVVINKKVKDQAMLIREIHPTNIKDKTKKRTDQYLFKPLILKSFIPMYHY